MATESNLLIIACGALAHEITTLIRVNAWPRITVKCLPAELHNRPQLIPQRMRDTLERFNGEFDRIFVAYADCGTGGKLDEVLDDFGVERIPGAHCYEFFAGQARFAELHDAEPGTLYLTDFLARHFDRLIVKGLGLDRFPELEADYFGNYRRLVYLSQREDAELTARAVAAAKRLNLEFVHHHTHYGDLATALSVQVEAPAWQS